MTEKRKGLPADYRDATPEDVAAGRNLTRPRSSHWALCSYDASPYGIDLGSLTTRSLS
jgi:hypothetical protein